MCVGGEVVLAKKSDNRTYFWGVPPMKEPMGTASTLGSSIITFMEDLALDLLCDSD